MKWIFTKGPGTYTSMRGVPKGISQMYLAFSRNTVKKYFEGNQAPWERQGLSGRQCYVITKEIIEFIQDCFVYFTLFTFIT